MRAPGEDFDAFVAAQSVSLLRTAYLLTGDRGHAEDLLQQVLVRTATRWRVAREAPEAYARRVLANLAKDRWRHLRRRPRETSAMRWTSRPRSVPSRRSPNAIS
jgi:DNA-directed RNA polymerase specialized sigma24 family protein